MTSRVLIVLPTRSYRAAAFLAAATTLGLEVVVAAEQASSLAPQLGGRELVVDLGDPELSAEHAVELDRLTPLAGVVGVDESAVATAAAIAARVGLPHHPVAAVAATRDKRLLRRALAAAAVRQPAFVQTSTAAEGAVLAAAVEAAGGFPVVVKPVGLAGSQGVLRADGAIQLSAAVARIGRLLDTLGCDHAGLAHPLLLERFIPGAEVAVEALVRSGRVDVLAVFDKPDPLDGPTFAETLYITPSRRPPAVLAAITALTAAAIGAVGLTDGPAHVELRIDPLTGPVVIEVAARSIGGLCSRAVRLAAAGQTDLAPVGLSLEEAIVGHACGCPLPGRLGPAPGATGVLMLPVSRSGVLRSVTGVGAALAVEGVTSVDLTVPVGATVAALPEGDRYLGFVVAAGDQPLRVERALRRAWDALEVLIT